MKVYLRVILVLLLISLSLACSGVNSSIDSYYNSDTKDFTNPVTSNRSKISSISQKFLTQTLNILNESDLALYSSKGNGTMDNPFVIENFNINFCADLQIGVKIENVNNYFILNNFYIAFTCDNRLPGIGIKMVNVTHGTITNTQIQGFANAIVIYNSSYNSFSDNYLVQNYFGFNMSFSSYNSFEGNNAVCSTTCSGSGYEIFNSDNNVLSNNRGNNFYISFDNSYSNNNEYINNFAINSSTGYGFIINFGKNNLFSNNTASNNVQSGFITFSSFNNTFNYNFAEYNNIYGFGISESNQTVLNYNVGINNKELDLYVKNDDNLVLNNNTFSNTNFSNNRINDNMPLFALLFISLGIVAFLAIATHRKGKTNVIKTSSDNSVNKKISSGSTCSKCHMPIEADSSFCQHCGNPIK